MEKFYDFLAVGVVICLFLFVLFCSFSIHKSGAQEIIPMPCPPAGHWVFKGPLAGFESLCQEVEMHDDGIVIPRLCPFRAKIKCGEFHPWTSVPCTFILKYQTGTEEGVT